MGFPGSVQRDDSETLLSNLTMGTSRTAEDTVELKRAIPEFGPAWDSSGFGTLYQEHSRRIYYLALRLLGNATQAEDATHDVFLKAFRKLGQFRGDSDVRTWLYRITINHCHNMLNAWHRRHIINNADETIWEKTPHHADSPFRVLETKELGQRIQNTLDGLSEEYRLLLLLVANERLSYLEIGELTHQTADAVRGKLHRARKAFAAAFPKTATTQL